MSEPNLYVFTEPAILLFGHLFEPVMFDERTNKFRKAENGEKGWYDATFLFGADSRDLAALKAIAKRLVDGAQFRDRDGNPIPDNLLQLPWESGEAFMRRQAAKRGDKADESLFSGRVLFKTSTIYAPLLNVYGNGQLTKYRDEMRGSAEKYFYPGVHVLAEVNLQTHQVGSNMPGVKAYLNELVSAATGDRLAGGRPTEEKFSGYIGARSSEDPTSGAGANPW